MDQLFIRSPLTRKHRHFLTACGRRISGWSWRCLERLSNAQKGEPERTENEGAEDDVNDDESAIEDACPRHRVFANCVPINATQPKPRQMTVNRQSARPIPR